MTEIVANINNDLDSISVAQSGSCDIDNCYEMEFNTANSLKIISQNIRSLNCNITNFETLLARSRTHWDVIVLTECWLSRSPNIPHMDGYNYFSTSKHKTQNEGVVIYYRHGIGATQRKHQHKRINIDGLDNTIKSIDLSPMYAMSDLFILYTVLKMHSQLSLNSAVSINKRRFTTICPIERKQFSFTQNFFNFLGPHLYNKINKELIIHSLTKTKLKKEVSAWLNKLDYETTERILKPLS
ncbi:hypothetical protein SFRURICE_019299 [Spodoptera frugiperda]|nr:hypothetical protein SFRURICE_019299 [Spodoptera frugiperda]